MLSSLPEQLLILSVLVSLFFIALGAWLLVTRVFKFTSSVIDLLEKDRTKDADKIKAEAVENAEKILEESRINALKIIEDSNKKASEVLLQASALSTTSQDEIRTASELLKQQHDEKIKELSLQTIKQLSDVMESEKTADVAQLHTLSSEAQSQLSTQISGFSEQLNRQLSMLSNSLADDFKNKYAIADKDIEEYKKLKIATLNKNIVKILEEVSVAILGKTVSMQDTQYYIEQTLKEKVDQIL